LLRFNLPLSIPNSISTLYV